MCPGSVLRFRWEVRKHLLHTFVEVLDVLVRFFGKCVARGAAPDQLLGSGIEEIDHQSANLVVLHRRRGIAQSAGPAPPAAEAVVKGVESLLVLSGLPRDDWDTATRRHLRPPLC